MTSRTKSAIKKIAIKTVIAFVIQAVIYIFYRFVFNEEVDGVIILFFALTVSVITLVFKVNPLYWFISTFFLYKLFDSIPVATGGLFLEGGLFPELDIILAFLAFAVTELLTSIITLLIKAFVIHIHCRNKIKLIISDDESAKKIYDENGVIHSFFLYNKIRKCCAASLKEEKIKEKAEVSLTIVSNEEIKELNREHREKDSVTDVLSFPLGENGEFDVNPETNRIMLGDIVISAERAAEQAKEYGHTFEREMCFLATHSMFHLLGYDHEVSEEEEKIMFDKQKMVLDKLGINR